MELHVAAHLLRQIVVGGGRLVVLEHVAQVSEQRHVSIECWLVRCAGVWCGVTRALAARGVRGARRRRR